MCVLVIAEHDNESLRISTLKTLTAAEQLNQEITVLVAGQACQSAADAAARIEGVSRVLHADSEHYQHSLAEELAVLIVDQVKQQSFTHVLAPATTFGKNVLPRAAALLDVATISDISQVVSEDTFVRPIYAGSALATVQSHDQIKVITVRPAAFDSVCEGGSAAVESIQASAVVGLSTYVGQELNESDRPELAAADVVVSGGRGVGSEENFDIIYKLADQLGAAVGASRAAVDAGYIANDLQVGQTGVVVAPELYIAVGISGAIQHLAGMKDSKVVVAINKDPDAAIFEVADYGLVADLFDAVPEMTEKLAALK